VNELPLAADRLSLDMPEKSHLSAERTIILSLSRLNPPEDVIGDVEKILATGEGRVDFEKLLRLAARNGVSPLLYENIRGLSTVPVHIKNRLRNAYLHTARENSLKLKETISILKALDKHAIPCLPLKGALASENILGNIALYPAADIDILIRPSDLNYVRSVLEEKGYNLAGGYEREMLSTHYHLVFTKPMHTVEVHWNLVKRYFPVSPDFWWEGTSTIHLEGMELPELSLEKYVICLVFRLFSHEFDTLKFLVLVSELINRHSGRIEWDKLLAYSEKCGMRLLMLFTLNVSSDLLGAEVPEHIRGKKIYGYSVLKNTVVEGLFKERRSSMGKLLYLLLLDTPLDILKAFMKRVFPGADELRLRYGIPGNSRKIYIYYLLNPVLLPMMMLKRKNR
jgi:hypothetical protein